jgi:hypothetical protein
MPLPIWPAPITPTVSILAVMAVLRRFAGASISQVRQKGKRPRAGR